MDKSDRPGLNEMYVHAVVVCCSVRSERYERNQSTEEPSGQDVSRPVALLTIISHQILTPRVRD